MSKIITKELFANSYYSIGAGLTLSPMLKMSHLTSDFIFCNLYLTKNEVIVINRYLAKKHHIEGNNVVIWESIKFSHYNNMVFSPASEIVQLLSDYLKKKEFSAKVHLIPYTTEDQGAAFIQCLSMLKNPTISYLYRPFDIVDLKLQQINN
ncbi:MAG: hypothetical protein K9I84_07490 [Leadbetterella sp.]|nr:hypothetical protein [Leadbetterella sp.]